jgi:hypothetical protein
VRSFAPIVPPLTRKGQTASSPDYSCILPPGGLNLGYPTEYQSAYLEVKNVRAPIGLTDAFSEAYWRLAVGSPDVLEFRIMLQHRCDNTVTSDQTATIEEFMKAFAKDPAPQNTTLVLPGQVEVQIRISEGPSGIVMKRSMGGAYPFGPCTDEMKFLEKAKDTIRKAIKQFSHYPNDTRLLALNLQTPDGTIPTDHLIRLQEIVAGESNGTVQCILFLQFHFIQP